jgi:hypothetical protein
MPDWCDSAELRVNGTAVAGWNVSADGYVHIRRTWTNGDTVEWSPAMPILRMKGHPLVRHTAGKIALQRGPLVYCLEEADNGPHLHQIVLPADSVLQLRSDAALLGGVATIQCEVGRMASDGWNGRLYRHEAAAVSTREEATFIPYYAWSNRGLGEMTVWVREGEPAAESGSGMFDGLFPVRGMSY